MSDLIGRADKFVDDFDNWHPLGGHLLRVDLKRAVFALLKEVTETEREKCAQICDDLKDLRRGYQENTVHAYREHERVAADTCEILASRIRQRSTQALVQEGKKR